MKPEQWQQAREVLADALELKPEDRPAFLDRACSSDHTLRREVERLLSSSDEARSSFLQSSTWHVTLMAGAKLGDYEVVRLLGAGGMGEVYRAKDTRLGREVAIKVLPAYLSHDPDRLRRFKQEARAAAALNHPNILAVHQMGTHEGAPYIVSELLEGSTLRGLLLRGPQPVRKAIDVGVQIARGLAAAHEKGIVHRDLKPENLFVTKDGRVKILDFGLAKLMQVHTDSRHRAPTATEGTEPGVVIGTVGYMAPEQVRGDVADHRADVFAFGAILYEMLTGKRVFQKPTAAETMSSILNEEPPGISQIVPSLPPALTRVVHRCLEKNPEQRFQSASDLAFAVEALSDSAVPSAASGHLQIRREPNRLLIMSVGAALTALLGAIAGHLWTRPTSVPKLSNYVQLTHDGQPKSLVGTDGSRLYLYLRTGDSRGMAEMSISGGEPRRVPILPSPRFLPVSLSQDGSQLLATNGQGSPPKGPLWTMPILGGSPRRLGDTTGQDAALSPDGTVLAYSNGSELFLAKADGTGSRKLIALENPNDYIYGLVWSFDQTNLRFYGLDEVGDQSSLWEVSAGGAHLHRLLPGWHNPPDECCGSWTGDGKYFIFVSNGQIWVLVRRGPFSFPQAQPIQLTSSPLSLSSPLPSKDGRKLFVVGETYRGELVRYDSKSGQFVPFLGGISAEYVAFSTDGKQVAYVSYPEGTLWRMGIDGSERMQLSYPPSRAMNPRWSRDGTKVVFHEMTAKPARILEVAADGATPPRQLIPEDANDQVDPTWSPDGARIVFGGFNHDPRTTIRVLELSSRQIFTLPGSQGLCSPRWSPSSGYIIAMTNDTSSLMLFDPQSQKWTALAHGSFMYPSWSKDGQYVYVLDSREHTVLRIRVRDRKTERVLDLRNFHTAGYYGGSGLALAKDDSLLLLRDAGTQDVYALDLEAP
jgi:serine/threonine protein kinase